MANNKEGLKGIDEIEVDVPIIAPNVNPEDQEVNAPASGELWLRQLHLNKYDGEDVGGGTIITTETVVIVRAEGVFNNALFPAHPPSHFWRLDGGAYRRFGMYGTPCFKYSKGGCVFCEALQKVKGEIVNPVLYRAVPVIAKSYCNTCYRRIDTRKSDSERQFTCNCDKALPGDPRIVLLRAANYNVFLAAVKNLVHNHRDPQVENAAKLNRVPLDQMDKSVWNPYLREFVFERADTKAGAGGSSSTTRYSLKLSGFIEEEELRSYLSRLFFKDEKYSVSVGDLIEAKRKPGQVLSPLQILLQYAWRIREEELAAMLWMPDEFKGVLEQNEVKEQKATVGEGLENEKELASFDIEEINIGDLS